MPHLSNSVSVHSYLALAKHERLTVTEVAEHCERQ